MPPPGRVPKLIRLPRPKIDMRKKLRLGIGVTKGIPILKPTDIVRRPVDRFVGTSVSKKWKRFKTPPTPKLHLRFSKPHIKFPDGTQPLAPIERHRLSKMAKTDIVRNILKHRDMRPAHAFLAGNITYYLSKILKTPSGRLYCIAISKSEGRLHPFFLYKSRSAGGWRTSPYMVGGWISKGRPKMYMADTELLEPLHRHLEGIEKSSTPIVVQKTKIEEMFDISRLGPEETHHEQSGVDGTLDIDSVVNILETIGFAGKIVQSREGDSPGIEDIFIPDEDIPDFTQQPLRIVRHNNRFLGDSLRLEYRSEQGNKDLRWDVIIANRDSLDDGIIDFVWPIKISDNRIVIIEDQSAKPRIHNVFPLHKHRPGHMFRRGTPPSIAELNHSLTDVFEYQTFYPNFHNAPIEVKKYTHALLGNCMRVRYQAHRGESPIIWDFVVRNSDGLAWILPPKFQDSEGTANGTQRISIDVGFLTHKPLEYTSQLKAAIDRPDLNRYIKPFDDNSGKDRYRDIRPLLAQLSIMQSFYNGTWYRQHFGIVRH